MGGLYMARRTAMRRIEQESGVVCPAVWILLQASNKLIESDQQKDHHAPTLAAHRATKRPTDHEEPSLNLHQVGATNCFCKESR